MASLTSPGITALNPERLEPQEAPSSGVSWGAVIGGAFVASAFYLILLALGAGLGLSAVSPWSNVGAVASGVGTVAIVWLIFIEIVSSALGGYLTGRLRTKWATIHTDEVYFRDTANGFLAWAVAAIIGFTLLATSAAAMVGRMAQSTDTTAGVTNPNAYFLDTLFRADVAPNSASNLLAEPREGSIRAEADRILARALEENRLPEADRTYLAKLVSARTALSQPDAEARVSAVITQARQAADTARRVTAHLLLWFFLALLMGAFSASYAATIGGRQRDHVKAV